MDRKQKEIGQKKDRNEQKMNRLWIEKGDTLDRNKIENEQIMDRKRRDTGQKQDRKFIEHGQ